MYPQQYTTPKANIAHWKLKVLLAVIPILAIAAWLAYQTITFHIVRTDPSFNNFPAISPMIDLYFNKELSTDGLSLKASGFTIGDYDVNNKALEIKMPTGGLQVGKTYSLTLVHVASTTHQLISNKTITFTAKDIPSTKLSPAQQKALVEQQDQYRYSATTIQFQNFDSLLNYGLTSNQLETVKEDLYGYSLDIHRQFHTITLDPDSVIVQTHDPNSTTLTDTYSFSFKPDNSAVLHAQLISDPINETVSVTVTDSAGAQVYSSDSAHD